MDLYEHERTGRLTWCDHRPGDLWHRTPKCHEDDLPVGMTMQECDWWFENSTIIDGVRFGPSMDRPIPGVHPTQQELAAAVSLFTGFFGKVREKIHG